MQARVHLEEALQHIRQGEVHGHPYSTVQYMATLTVLCEHMAALTVLCSTWILVIVQYMPWLLLCKYMTNVASSMRACTLKRPCSTLGRAKYMATCTNVHNTTNVILSQCCMHVCTLKRPCSTLGRAKYMATRTNVHLEEALQHIRQGEVGPQLFITDVVAVLA